MLRFTLLTAAAFAATAASPNPTRAADEGKGFLGSWTAEVDNFKAVWNISQSVNGKWRVAASYYDSKGKPHGGFEGKDYKLEGGKLTFTQVWTKKPRSTWHDNATITLTLEDADTLKEAWHAGDHKGHRELKRVKK